MNLQFYSHCKELQRKTFARGNQKLIVTEIIVVDVPSSFTLIISVNNSQKFPLIDSEMNKKMQRKLLKKERRSLLLK